MGDAWSSTRLSRVPGWSKESARVPGPGDKAQPPGKLGKDEDPALSAVIQNWRESRPGVSKESQGTCPAAVILRD